MVSEVKRERIEAEIERLAKNLERLQAQHTDLENAIKYHFGAIEFAKSLLVEPKEESTKVTEMQKPEAINEEALQQ